MTVKVLYLFYTLRSLSLKQLVFRGVRAVQRLVAGSYPSACRPHGSRASVQLFLHQWLHSTGSLRSDEIEILGERFPIESPERIDYRAPGRDALFRYLLSGHGYLLAQTVDSDLVRRVLLSASSRVCGRSAAANRRLYRRSNVRFLPLMEPHPLSLRLIHWVRLLSVPVSLRDDIRTDRLRHRLSGEDLSLILSALASQTALLLRRIEYETDGNHLIDNSVALLYAGAALVSATSSSPDAEALWMRVGTRALRRGWEHLRIERTKQVLADGCHIERSASYHLLVLERMLDALSLLRNNSVHQHLARRAADTARAAHALRIGAARMLAWARCHRWGTDPPPVNDGIPGLAPSLPALESYAAELEVPELPADASPVRDQGRIGGELSGYEIRREGRSSVFMDRAPIGASHVPGHAHADTLQVLVSFESGDVLVDTGTTLYEQGIVRTRERGTGAHNTVIWGGKSQSEVWASFRVARRAHCTELAQSDFAPVHRELKPAELQWFCGAEHDGYSRYGITHRRAVWLSGGRDRGRVLIRDELLRTANEPSYGIACYILAPERAHPIGGPVQASDGSWELHLPDINIRFVCRAVSAREHTLRPRIEPWQVAVGYRKRVETVRIVAPFFDVLETDIYEP